MSYSNDSEPWLHPSHGGVWWGADHTGRSAYSSRQYKHHYSYFVKQVRIQHFLTCFDIQIFKICPNLSGSRHRGPHKLPPQAVVAPPCLEDIFSFWCKEVPAHFVGFPASASERWLLLEGLWFSSVPHLDTGALAAAAGPCADRVRR